MEIERLREAIVRGREVYNSSGFVSRCSRRQEGVDGTCRLPNRNETLLLKSLSDL